VKAWLLPNDALQQFSADLMAAHRLIAPVRREDELRFAEVTSADQVELSFRNTVKAPKDVLLPQTECMIRYEKVLDRFDAVVEVPIDVRPTVLLGVRPCDARSYLLMDRVFGEGRYVDPYYRARRDHLTVVSMACDRPRMTCFCHAFESGPDDPEGSDVMLYPAGDAYVVRTFTAKGAELLATLDLAEADADHVDAAERSKEQAREMLAEIEPVAGIEEALSGLFDSEMWADIANKCLACGTCTYNCPTCHCFTIEDKTRATGGERVRVWDSCMYGKFTVHTSGHNPRPDQAARWRQRTMHKFEYLPRNVDLYGCVGCGRCIRSCPVRLDIRAVLQRVREETVDQVTT